MKATQILFGTLVCGTSLLGRHSFAAGFANLNFEDPQTPLVANDPWGYRRVPASSAFPGWTAYAGTRVEPLVNHNAAFLASAGLGLWGPEPVWNPDMFTGGSIDGNYTAFLQSGRELFYVGNDSVSASLSQTGLVPTEAKYLQMKAFAYGPFSVWLEGQQISMLPSETSTNYTLFIGEVSAFAGQTAELRITSEYWLGPTSHSYLWLDAIAFSPVPEPSTMAFLVTGAILFAWRWGTARRR